MYEWHRQIQIIVDEIDECIKHRDDEALTLRFADYSGEVPVGMLMVDVPESEYIVFEHGPFDYDQENDSVGDSVIVAAEGFDYSETEYVLDGSPGRMAYFYHDPEQFYKHIKPVRRRI